MASDDGGPHDFVAGRYADLRRSAYLMCGDWALADERTQRSLARLVTESRRTAVDDPDAFAYSHLMASFQRRRSGSRRHLFAATRPGRKAEAGSATRPGRRAGADVTRGAILETLPAAAPPRYRSSGVSATETPPTDKIADIHPSGVSAAEAPPADKIADIRPVAGGPVQPDGPPGAAAGDPIRTTLVLEALHELAPRCRAVLVLRHWAGFEVGETADMLGLAAGRVDAYEAAGLAALDYLLADKEPAR